MNVGRIPSRGIPVCIRLVIGGGIVLATAVTTCAVQPEGAADGARAEEPSSATSAIVRNMPVNSGYRCVGIAAVVDALLEGECADEGGEQVAEELAKQIYEALVTGRQVRYGRHLVIDGERLATQSREALEKLSTMVADLYKEDYRRSIETDTGRRRLFRAASDLVRTRAELDALLDRDADNTEFFCASGTRSFPDGTTKETHHAVLIFKGPNGELSVLDSNDPGAPIPCRVETDRHGLIVRWTCRYKQSGPITTQRYRIMPREGCFGRDSGRADTGGRP